MVLNFFQLRNHTSFTFQLLNSEKAKDNYTVGPYEKEVRGDMWLAMGEGKRGITIQAFGDGSPVYELLFMWDHDWAIRYRLAGEAATHSIPVNGNKDFSIDAYDDRLSFVCYNGTFTGSEDVIHVRDWKRYLTKIK